MTELPISQTRRRVRSHHDKGLWRDVRPVIVRACAYGVFALVVFILVFSLMTLGKADLTVHGPIMIALVVAGVLWIVRLILSREPKVAFSLLGTPILILGTWTVVRYALAGGESGVESVARLDMMLGISAAALFFIVLNIVRHGWQVTVLTWVWAGGGCLLAIEGLGRLLHGGGLYETFPSAADFIMPMHIMFAVVTAQFFFSRRSFPERIVLAFCATLMLVTMVLIELWWQWAGFMACVGVLVVYIIRKRGWRFHWAIAGGTILVVVVIATLFALRWLQVDARSSALDNTQRIARGEDREPGQTDVSVQEMTEGEAGLSVAVPALWRGAISMAQRSLIQGAGPGMYPWLFPIYRTGQGKADSPGNVYLTVLAEYGMIGVMLLLWVIVVFFVAATHIVGLRAQRYSASTPSNRYAMVVGGLAAMAALSVDAVFGGNLRSTNLFNLVVFVATILTCGVQHDSKGDESSYRPGKHSRFRLTGLSRWVLAGAMAGFLLLLMSRLWCSYAAHLLWRVAERERVQLNWSVSERRYQQALRFDGRNYQIVASFGDFYAMRAAWDVAGREEWARQALHYYKHSNNSALTLNSYASDIWIRMGRLYDLLQKRDDAKDAFQRAIEADSRNAAYYVAKGLHHQRWGEEQEASAAFQRARSLAGIGRSKQITP